MGTSQVDLPGLPEEEAKKRTKQLADANAVELWQGSRKIARYEPQR
jgi:hypothetical protein